jgi:hypothetical protein
MSAAGDIVATLSLDSAPFQAGVGGARDSLRSFYEQELPPANEKLELFEGLSMRSGKQLSRLGGMISNVGASLEGVVPGLGTLTEGVGFATAGLGTMTSVSMLASKALVTLTTSFLASPLGIAAMGAAALYGAYKLLSMKTAAQEARESLEKLNATSLENISKALEKASTYKPEFTADIHGGATMQEDDTAKRLIAIREAKYTTERELVELRNRAEELRAGGSFDPKTNEAIVTAKEKISQLTYREQLAVEQLAAAEAKAYDEHIFDVFSQAEETAIGTIDDLNEKLRDFGKSKDELDLEKLEGQLGATLFSDADKGLLIDFFEWMQGEIDELKWDEALGEALDRAAEKADAFVKHLQDQAFAATHTAEEVFQKQLDEQHLTPEQRQQAQANHDLTENAKAWEEINRALDKWLDKPTKPAKQTKAEKDELPKALEAGSAEAWKKITAAMYGTDQEEQLAAAQATAANTDRIANALENPPPDGDGDLDMPG